MNNRLTGMDTTCSVGGGPRRQLVEVLEKYLAELEQGTAPDHSAFLAAHPDLSDELKPYLESLQLLHGATRDMRPSQPSTNGLNDLQGDGLRGDGATAGGKQIGDYRIVREIGRGGMGIVYEAHQKSLNRRVALKILPFAAVLDQRQIARFRNEAQAAAQLHHPHIVPVFAVGQERGVYYYAMQYIDGQSLEQAIGELQERPDVHGGRTTKAAGATRGSTTTMRFEAASLLTSHRSIRPPELFNTVARLGKEAAEALQHAHEHGIVHRDVKPSNLLVDGLGKLWVTDFGLARMQANGGVTLTGDVVGTLRYMSPEQAAGRTELVDARTDVYSLGVSLYELLTHCHAFGGDDRQTLLRQIVEEEPVSPRRINPAVPLDLETIVLGAMAKSREDRYPTAQAMADDLDRFLTGKPTLARRPTLADRAAKWARRHRSVVAVAACSLAVLCVVSAVGTALLLRAQFQTSQALTRAQSSAQAARDSFAQAERHFRQALGAVDQFGMGMADRLLGIPGAEAVRRDLMVDTLGFYRQFVAEAGDDPELRRDLALAHFKSGVIAAKLGAVSDAIAEYEAAIVLFRDLAAAGTNSPESRARLAVTLNNLALLLTGRGDVENAQRHYDEAIALQRGLVAEHPSEAVLASRLAESQANLGMLLDQIGEDDRAEQSLRAAVDLLRPLAESQANQPAYAHSLAIASNNLSFVLRSRNIVEAAKASQEAIAILERLKQAHPDHVEYQDDLALCYNNLAAMESHKGRLSAAIDWHRRAIELQEQIARKSPAVVRHRSDLAVSFNNLGVAYCRANQSTNADAAFTRARELLATLADDYPDELAYSSSLAALLNNQALALADSGRHAEALEIYPAAIEAQRDSLARLPESVVLRDVLSKMYYNYGESLRNAGRVDAAADVALERRAIWQGNGGRLFGVAVELAEIGRASRKMPSGGATEELTKQLDDQVVTTLQMADASGLPQAVDLAADKRFDYLAGHRGFAALANEWKKKSVLASPQPVGQTGAPSSAN